MNDEELSALIHQHATRYEAGERLRAGVRTQIALQAAARAGNGTAAAPRRWAGFGWRGVTAGFAAGVALGAMLVFALGGSVPPFGAQDSLQAELVAAHVRALKTGPLVDVASSDRHTVKPWFQGRLDFAPTVIDLAADGFPLLGGRVAQVAGAPVAALAYAHNRHILNVFVWPAGREQAAQRTQRKGFNLLHWSDGAMQVWVVSDIEGADLERFGQAWRAAGAARP